MKYELLPFNFRRLADGVLLVGAFGQSMLLPDPVFHELVTDGLSEESEAYQNLKSRFFLFDTDFANLEELLAVRYLTKRSFLMDFTVLHMVVPTIMCNSRCVYCQVSSRQVGFSKYSMDKRTADKVVEMILRSPSDSLKVEFQGGEPLLNFAIIKRIVKLLRRGAARVGKQIEFVICTNLLLIEQEHVSFFKDNDVYVSTSLDGDEPMHDANRPLWRDDRSSYELFIKKLNYVREGLGDNKVSALLTVTKPSLSKLRRAVDAYVENGFGSIFIRPINPFGRACGEAFEQYGDEEFSRAYFDALDYILELNKRGTFIVEEWAAILLRSILTPFATGFVDLRSPSGLGIGCAIYNYDGNVYASDEGRMLAEAGDRSFLLGNVHESGYLDIFAGSKLRGMVADSVLETLPGCSFCAYSVFCGVDPVRLKQEGRDARSPAASSTCVRTMATLDYLFKSIYGPDKEAMKVFESWVFGRRRG